MVKRAVSVVRTNSWVMWALVEVIVMWALVEIIVVKRSLVWNSVVWGRVME